MVVTAARRVKSPRVGELATAAPLKIPELAALVVVHGAIAARSKSSANRMSPGAACASGPPARARSGVSHSTRGPPPASLVYVIGMRFITAFVELLYEFDYLTVSGRGAKPMTSHSVKLGFDL